MAFTVVLLDDEEDILDVVHEFLTNHRKTWTVVKTSEAQDCLDTCNTLSPDVVIIDDILHGDTMQGHDVMRELFRRRQSHGASIPVLVMLTMRDRSDFVAQGWAAGNIFINKDSFAEDPTKMLAEIEHHYQENVPHGRARLDESPEDR